jgi:hypothetical protein
LRIPGNADSYISDVCAKYALMVNRNDAIGTNEWQNIPIEKQMAWRIPIEVMIDIPHLRQKHNVITLSEYFILQGLDIRRETSNGHWDRDYYHNGIDHPTLFVLENHAYDPKEIARVDSWDPTAYQIRNITSVSKEMAVKCDEQLIARSAQKDKAVLSWQDASQAINHAIGQANETQVELALEAAGWVVLQTFEGQYVHHHVNVYHDLLIVLVALEWTIQRRSSNRSGKSHAMTVSMVLSRNTRTSPRMCSSSRVRYI